MTVRAGLLALLIGVLVGLAAFYLVASQLGGPWFGVANDAQALRLLETSQQDLKRLAVSDPARAAEYRARFEEIQVLANRMRILGHNREVIARRYRVVLLLAVGGALALAGTVIVLGQRRDRRRLKLLGEALEALASGSTDVRVGVHGSGSIATIAAMIERTSRTMARDRQRMASLSNIAAWQEGARRQAHELRTPLAAARLAIDRIGDIITGGGAGNPTIAGALDEVRRDLDQLGSLTQRFASFARLPAPRPVRCDFAEVVREFVDGFGAAWPNVQLRLGGSPGRVDVAVDREMFRQVLVNLCENSAHASNGRQATITFTVKRSASHPGFVALEIADDGPGVAEPVRARLFEPYVTTRNVGEGMGLGLAISRKIMLDHGGDLELAATSNSGAVFRLLLPEGGIG